MTKLLLLPHLEPPSCQGERGWKKGRAVRRENRGVRTKDTAVTSNRDCTRGHDGDMAAQQEKQEVMEATTQSPRTPFRHLRDTCSNQIKGKKQGLRV